jgi:hypothetical protein
VFGRLYFHLQHRYAYKKDDGTNVDFFDIDSPAKSRIYRINFPYMASMLADLRHENHRVMRTFYVSLVSLAISLLSLGVSIAK